ncbi:fimbrial protein [Serratia entomophila]|uniref:fimbrial protein n=1 Tax=Serratia entomophila TaxID=42906 RepID=UPI00217A707E|nr:fimbrial protein [Serratia entomophila]CAI1002435.1 S-fimbrial protein subunit SfaG precursor [Serratia entomophila]CAI1558259.1 S-fimbrial protein subunit SfaG precursor [Serratia entomophila]CAI1652069.1 S-fimbrial protein subunit SfaG precursor [Serratia entomophila]CAI1708907.1 S-fimbrial protein subunit SfaG precursor [Serratia entomophila]CAI1793449.1 S-fimbrial protein subunit SfaG precursor [Serratia entomophila]
MKKNLLAVAVLTASAFTTSAFAADGVLNITGSITDQSCTVDPDSQNKQVALGKIAKDAFTASKTAGAKAFNLVLKSCPATVTGATVRFDGTQIQGQSGLLALTQDAGKEAKGVGIQLLDDASNVLNIGNDSRVYSLAENKDNVLGFVARYYAYDTVSVGSANSTANFTIVYQ